MRFKKFGKYTIIKKIASGGMADILLASDLSPTGFGRFIVIKRALAKFSENEEFKDMFKNEGKVACNLKHRNITSIYEFGIEDNQFFLSMEYISGRNLRELSTSLQNRNQELSIPNAVYITKEIASGLNYAHNAIDSNTGQPLNLIHRDVSPQNIMLSFDGEIKLIDFGIAKIADTNLTRAGHLKGKFSYMSPEQAHGEVLDGRNDIFCLGIILWESLTNKRLFASKNELTSLKKIKNCAIPNAQKLNPKIPTELNDIIMKALAKNKNIRYKTAAHLAQALNVFLNKNYPEYSHYDFISLMKKTYRKEIMQEREKLKIFSSEFKKYLNSLNLAEDLENKNINLTIPNLITIESKKENLDSKQEETKSIYEESIRKGEQSLSDYTNHFQEKTKTQRNTKTEDKGETKSVRIQLKDLTVNTKTDNPLISTKHTDILKSEADWFTSTEQTDKSFSTNHRNKKSYLFSEQDILEDEVYSRKKKKKEITLSLFVIFFFIGGIGTGAIYFMKNKKRKVHIAIKENTKIHVQKETQIPTLIPSIPAPIKIQTPIASIKTKIFINSKPSGAAIFINNKFSSRYTPTLVSLPRENSTITLKKQGYQSKSLTFNKKNQTKKSLNIILETNQPRDISSKKIIIQESF